MSQQQKSNVMDDLHSKVVNVLENNFVNKVQDLSTGSLKCMDHANNMAVTSLIFNSLGTVIAFSEAYFGTQYLALAAGCLMAIGVALHGLSHYSDSQSRYRDSMLTSTLTSGYQFLNNFASNPLSLPAQQQPQMPDSENDGTSALPAPSKTQQIQSDTDVKFHDANTKSTQPDPNSKSASPPVPNISISVADVSHS
jgi:hypothetical protein